MTGYPKKTLKNSYLLLCLSMLILWHCTEIPDDDDTTIILARFTVTFNTNGGNPGIIESVVVDSGVALGEKFPNNPEREHYTFGGWFYGDEEYTESMEITRTVDLTARWDVVRYTLTVSINPEESGFVSPETSIHDALTRVSVTVMVNFGYMFTGWTGAPPDVNPSSISVAFNISSDVAMTANFRQVTVITGSFTDSRDEQVYRTVTIGSQIWMAENLNYAGDDGSLGACYDNDTSYCDTYGRFYDWSTVMNFAPFCNNNRCASRAQSPHHQGICPGGWHVPSNVEWETLVNFAGGSSIAGINLKSAAGWFADGDGMDVFGFSALPGGSGSNSNFYGAGYNGAWWSATESGAIFARFRYMFYDINDVYWYWDGKLNQFSLRCVKNDFTP